MKWCRVEIDGRPAFGIVEGQDIAIIDAPPYGPHGKTGKKDFVKVARLLPPVVPPNFYAAGHQLSRTTSSGPTVSRHVAFKPPTQADIRLPLRQRPGRQRRRHRHSADAPGPIHFKASGSRLSRRFPRMFPRESARLRRRLHARQRSKRAQLPEERPDAVAGEEHRHLQADGAGGGLRHRSDGH